MKTILSEEQKLYFLYGALYGFACSMKSDGCFADLGVRDIVKLLMDDMDRQRSDFRHIRGNHDRTKTQLQPRRRCDRDER